MFLFYVFENKQAFQMFFIAKNNKILSGINSTHNKY